jgi:hypothetical protein
MRVGKAIIMLSKEFFDLALTGAQAWILYCEVNILRKPSYVPRLSSFGYFLALTIISISLLGLEAPLGSLVSGIGAFVWALILWKRGKPN